MTTLTVSALVEEIKGFANLKFGAYFDNVDCTVEHESHPEFFTNCKALIEKELGGKLDSFREIQHDLYNDSVLYYFPTNLSDDACYLLIDLLVYGMNSGNGGMMYLDYHKVAHTEDDLREIMGEDYVWDRDSFASGLDIDTLVVPNVGTFEIPTIMTQMVQEMMEEDGTVFDED